MTGGHHGQAGGATFTRRRGARDYPFVFTGTAGGFFGIWIVNILLTIVTFGIYSAWAKVRTNRYFYGNSWLDGHNFEYHAKPRQILIGRLIAFAVFIVYTIIGSYSPIAGGVIGLVVLIAMPWLIVASLRFGARMSSYRNVRFDFTGTPGQAAKYYLLYPFLAALTLFLAWPASARASYGYLGDHYRYGGRPFRTDLSLKFFYITYGVGLIFVLLPVAVLFAGSIIVALGGAESPIAASFVIFAPIVIIVVFVITSIFIRTRCVNHLFSHLLLDGQHGFRSTMAPGMMIWIALSNILAIICSLGLLYPWARIRQTRYRLRHLVAVSGGDLSVFVSEAGDSASAIGEELADVFDIGVGV